MAIFALGHFILSHPVEKLLDRRGRD